MKFTWFNLMLWPYLPDDFREKHRSVRVDIPNTLYDLYQGGNGRAAGGRWGGERVFRQPGLYPVHALRSADPGPLAARTGR